MNNLQPLFRPARHSTEIARLFDGRTQFDGDAPQFGTPLYVLAFTNRSGSNLLAGYLAAHPALYGFEEVLNAEVAAEHMGPRQLHSYPDFIRFVARHQNRGKTGAAFGVKASAEQLAMLLRWRIDRMFGGLRVIHIERRDVVRQAISFRRALQTRQWTSDQPSASAPDTDYSFDAICNHVSGFRLDNLKIRLLIDSHGLSATSVTYEDLTGDPGTIVQGILNWAGIDAPGWTLPPARYRRQADARSDAIRGRFLADMAARFDAA